jgi:heme exporter protein A
MLKITVKNLSMRFGFRGIFKDISFELESPSSLAITGPNGSGKSTLLKIISGLLIPTGGNAAFYESGKALGHDKLRGILAMVSPEMNFYDELTGSENLEFFMKSMGRQVGKSEVENSLDKVGLKGRGDDYLKGYSSGMKMRSRPQILIVDEPSTNLDVGGKKLVYELLKEHKKHGVLIYATNEDEELGIADKRIALGN